MFFVFFFIIFLLVEINPIPVADSCITTYSFLRGGTPMMKDKGSKLLMDLFVHIINYQVSIVQFKTYVSIMNVELDSHSDSTVVGHRVYVLDYTSWKVSVSGFINELEKQILVEVVNDMIIYDCEKTG